MTVVSLTGHRPDGLKDIEFIVAATNVVFDVLNPSLVITGMAKGYDLLGGKIAMDRGIDILCAVPYWSHIDKKDQKYVQLMDAAKEIVIVSPGPYAVWKLHKRNHYMVDNSEVTVACWNGAESGGTYKCLEYVKKKDKPYFRINEKDQVWSVHNNVPS